MLLWGFFWFLNFHWNANFTISNFSMLGYMHFPGHAWHEKRLQRQILFVTLINSQERRALAVPLINRLSTVDELVVNRGFCFSVGFKCELDCSCFRRDVQDNFLRFSGVHKGQMSPWRTGQSTSLPAWYVRVLNSAGVFQRINVFNGCFGLVGPLKISSNEKVPGHTVQEKGFKETKKVSVHLSAASNKARLSSRGQTVDKPRVSSMFWGRTVLSASLPGRNPPPQRAPRPESVVCPDFGFDSSESAN